MSPFAVAPAKPLAPTTMKKEQKKKKKMKKEQELGEDDGFLYLSSRDLMACHPLWQAPAKLPPLPTLSLVLASFLGGCVGGGGGGGLLMFMHSCCRSHLPPQKVLSSRDMTLQTLYRDLRMQPTPVTAPIYIYICTIRQPPCIYIHRELLDAALHLSHVYTTTTTTLLLCS